MIVGPIWLSWLSWHLIRAVASPGYYVTVLMVEKLGRKWIQVQGFLLTALFRMYYSLLRYLI